jgi:hypothetical protein
MRSNLGRRTYPLARMGRGLWLGLALVGLGCGTETINPPLDNTGGTSSATGGTPGNPGTGGTSTGGTSVSTTGGTSTGGKASGGAGVGGTAAGGMPSGGKASGGSTPTGGQASGGTATGGAATGGRTTGGAFTGGAAMGGATTGGKSTGGTPSGGMATGGKATGGTATGGKATGGSGTIGAWTTGYVATMYGNVNLGDCVGYSSFSDNTNYNSQTCPNVTKASYSSGVANNASYYGATGDLSSLWVGAQCQCPGGGTGDCSQAPSCPSESQSGGNCGMCVAVKCDPSGTFSLSGTTHNADCSTTTYVVVQIIDACPHNHPTNVASSVGWCTSRQANHIDLSCSGLGDISTLGTSVGRDGWLNVAVQKVDCSVGLGKHSL